eukprot:4150801-Amphidinium_carterae.1
MKSQPPASDHYRDGIVHAAIGGRFSCLTMGCGGSKEQVVEPRNESVCYDLELEHRFDLLPRVLLATTYLRCHPPMAYISVCV